MTFKAPQFGDGKSEAIPTPAYKNISTSVYIGLNVTWVWGNTSMFVIQHHSATLVWVTIVESFGAS